MQCFFTDKLIRYNQKYVFSSRNYYICRLLACYNKKEVELSNNKIMKICISRTNTEPEFQLHL